MSPLNKKNVLTIVLIVLIVINIAALLTFIFWPRFHFSRNEQENCQPGRHHDFMRTELMLTEEQTTQFDQLRKSHTDTLAVCMDAIQEMRFELTNEMMKTNPDTALIDQHAAKIGEIYGNIRKLNVLHYWQMRKLCNNDQQKKLDTMFKKMFCCDEKTFSRFENRRGHSCVSDTQNRCNHHRNTSD